MPGKQRKPRVTRKEKKIHIAGIIETALVTKDVMDEFKDFSVFHCDGIDLKIEYQTSETMKREDMDQVFNLFKINMQDLYEESHWGWDEDKKKEEFTHEYAKYLIVRNSDGKILGFTHFRYEIEANHPILYCYELQVAEEIQRKGLGKHLMNLLHLIAFKFKLVKVMLTVFTYNTPALDFYMKSLGFRRDETCPYEEEGKCYVILSKCLDKSLINDIKTKMHVK